MNNLGTIAATGNTRTLRFERRLPQSPEQIWAALTEPARIGGWLTDASVDPREGGEISFDFGPDNVVRGVITAWLPPHELEYGWRFPDGHDSQVRWTLEPDGDGTLLTLVHERLRQEQATGYGAGWHTYVDRLAGHLDGNLPEFQPRFEELRPRYEEVARTA
jgi:uncharacterized protein YndB with AHSA1/START domain